MFFYFVRHGETEYNLMKIAAGGTIDCALTSNGFRQAALLKETIYNLPVNTVISSPLIRAKQTAEIIWPDGLIIEEGLRELDLGNFAGLPDIECIKLVTDDHPRNIPMPGGGIA